MPRGRKGLAAEFGGGDGGVFDVDDDASAEFEAGAMDEARNDTEIPRAVRMNVIVVGLAGKFIFEGSEEFAQD